MTSLIMTADRFGLHSLAEWFKKLQANHRRERLARQTIKELSALTDHELNDLGIARGEIWSIAYDLDDNYERKVNANLKGWV